jgi:hypothetical protein
MYMRQRDDFQTQRSSLIFIDLEKRKRLKFGSVSGIVGIHLRIQATVSRLCEICNQ